MNFAPTEPERMMAKVQKNFLISEELAQVLDKVMELSGLNFTKLATAALCQYLFERCNHPDEREPGEPLIGPDAQWTSVVWQLERGSTSLGDVPALILKDSIALAQTFLKFAEARGDKSATKRWTETLRRRRAALNAWESEVDESGGSLPAILAEIEDCFRK